MDLFVQEINQKTAFSLTKFANVQKNSILVFLVRHMISPLFVHLYNFACLDDY